MSKVFEYISLMKPRVLLLVIFTTICGLIVAPENITFFKSFFSIFATTLGAGGAAAINMWYDRDIDKIMLRTAKRAIIREVITPKEAFIFGIVLSFIAILVMSTLVNLISAIILGYAIFHYTVVYTVLLKRSSIQNVVIGGLSGALSPLIGYSSISSSITKESFILFLIIFLWTPPHSWAIAIFRLDDYKNSHVPMMPVIKGIDYTNKYILIYSILLITSAFFPYIFNIAGIVYLITSSILGVVLLAYVYRLYNNKNEIDIKQNAKNLFSFSLIYLFLIFLAISLQL